MGFSLASGVDPLFRSGSKDQRIRLPSAKTRLHSRNPNRLTKTGWPEWVVVIKLGYRSGIVSRDPPRWECAAVKIARLSFFQKRRMSNGFYAPKADN
jgi:hypothetical protein